MVDGRHIWSRSFDNKATHFGKFFLWERSVTWQSWS